MTDPTATDVAFDIEAWLSDAQLPEGSVRVNKHGHLVVRLEELRVAHDEARKLEATQPPRRLSQKKGADEAGGSLAIAQEMEAVRSQLESGWLTFRLRGLTSDELATVNASKGDKTLVSLQIQIVEPAMTLAQIRTMRDRIGVGQFTALVSKASELAFGEVSTPDFSAAVYATLATRASSTT